MPLWALFRTPTFFNRSCALDGHRRWRTPPRSHSMERWLFHFLDSDKEVKTVFCHTNGIGKLLIALVAHGESTPCNNYMHEVSSRNAASWGINGRNTVRPGNFPTVGLVVSCNLAAYKRSLRYFWVLIIWMLCIGGARHPGHQY